MITRRRFIATTAGAGVSLMAGGISFAKAKHVTLRIGTQPTMIAPLWNAYAQGLFKKNGVDLKFAKFSTGPATMAALKNGAIDIAWGAPVTFYFISSSGAKVVWPATVGNFNDADGMAVGPNSPIKTVKDLKGKTIAVPFYTTVYGPLLLLLKKYQLRDSVKLINLKPPQGVAAVLSGSADAVFAWQPYINSIIEQGGRFLLHSKDTPGGGWSWTGFATMQHWAQANVDLLALFYKIFNQGRDGLQDERERVIKTAVSIGMPEKSARIEFPQLQWPPLVNNVTPGTQISMCQAEQGKGLVQTLNQVRNLYTRIGKLKNTTPYADFLDPAPLNQLYGKSCQV